MPRTRSSYSASPVRYRSPQRSPNRDPPSEAGTEYEMDLDALGLNSTFESSRLDESHEPDVDVVKSDEIEGPEDFTMNMTYWMTADLPLAQLRSRKEAQATTQELRADMQRNLSGSQDTTEQGHEPVNEEHAPTAQQDYDSRSPTMRANGTSDERTDNTEPSETSMANDEKVMSYLSALPDTDVGSALTSTPLRIQKSNLLQVPNRSPKARSLQATVEDYTDTPRKPTQETVIHHPATGLTTEQNLMPDDALEMQIADLKARLEQQQLVSTTRITELETILNFTRSELDAARTDIYRYKSEIDGLERTKESMMHQQKDADASFDAKLKALAQEQNLKMEEFGEELRLQNLAKIQSQREGFERELKALEENSRSTDAQLRQKDVILKQLQADMEASKHSHSRELESARSSRDEEQQKLQQLQSDLEESKQSRERELEILRSGQFGGQQKLQLLQNELEECRLAKERELGDIRNLYTAEQQNRENVFAKERADLNDRLSILQSRASTLQADLEKATADAKAAREEAQVNAALQSTSQSSQLGEKSKSSALEARVQSLESALESSRADLAIKDRELLRRIEEQECVDQQLHAAKGRMEGLETTISTLRQQLTEAHRESSKARADAERFENGLEDATDRLQHTCTEADRRVADVQRKLARMKEAKTDADAKLQELQSERDELVDDHEAKIEDVRSKAEEALRKVGAMLEQERSEKKKLLKELNSSKIQNEQLRSEAAQHASAEDEESSSDESSHSNFQNDQVEKLRTLIRTQASELKKLKAEITPLRKQDGFSSALTAEVEALRAENDVLKSEAESQHEEFEAINKQMDERLAAMLKTVLRERSRKAVGKRDEQWLENVERLKDERVLMGKVLMREWGKQECGVAEGEEKQRYRYKYVKRTA